MAENNQHFIQQTVVGPICTFCECRVSKDKKLFSCSINTIKAHWKKNGCCSIGASPSHVNKQLLERLRYLHSTSIRNKQNAFQHFREGDEGVKRTQRYYCSYCGLVAQQNVLNRQHCTPAEGTLGGGKCPGRPVQGFVLSNKYNQLVPESFLNDIVADNSPLRQLKPHIIITPPIIAPPTSTTVEPQQHVATTTTTIATITPSRQTNPPPLKRIKVSPAQLNMATSTEYVSPTDRYSMVMQQIQNLDHAGAEQHLIFFLHMCLGGGDLKEKLLSMALSQHSSYDSNSDDHLLKPLLRAAELWFTSQSANIDVKLINTHMRSAMYKVGTNAEDDDSDLLRGKTFVPTNDLEHVKKEVKYLLSFLRRGDHIHNDLIDALQTIYESVPYNESNVDSFIDDVAQRS